MIYHAVVDMTGTVEFEAENDDAAVAYVDKLTVELDDMDNAVNVQICGVTVAVDDGYAYLDVEKDEEELDEEQD